MNTVIREIIASVLNMTCVEKSDLDINDREIGKKLFESAIELLNDKHWVSKYLERDLDEDFYGCCIYENLTL